MFRLGVLLGVALSAFASGTLGAEPVSGTAASAAPPGLASEAAALLRRMGTTIAAAPGFTVSVVTTREAPLASGPTVLLGASGSIALRRPDRLAAAFGSDLGSMAAWSDGSEIAVLNLNANAFARARVAGSTQEALHWLEARLGMEVPLGPLVAADPHAALLEPGPTQDFLLGRSFIGDAAVDHLLPRNPVADWEIWLEASALALPLRVSVMAWTTGRPLRVTYDFSRWELEPTLPDRVFVFVPRSGAREVTLPAPQ